MCKETLRKQSEICFTILFEALQSGFSKELKKTTLAITMITTKGTIPYKVLFDKFF